MVYKLQLELISGADFVVFRAEDVWKNAGRKPYVSMAVAVCRDLPQRPLGGPSPPVCRCCSSSWQSSGAAMRRDLSLPKGPDAAY